MVEVHPYNLKSTWNHWDSRNLIGSARKWLRR